MFGGTTASFPALKRNAANLDLRLADDSGYTSLTGATATWSNAIAANTVTDGETLTNTTAATSGNQSYSPAFHQIGRGFASTGGTSMVTEFRSYVVPVQGTAAPSALWTLESQVNSGGWGNSVTVDTLGNFVASRSLTSGTPPTGISVGEVSSAVNTGRGIYYFGSNGSKYLDGSSSTLTALGFSIFSVPSATGQLIFNSDTSVQRNAAAIVEINNGTAGQWGALKLGTYDTGTTNAPTCLTITHNSSNAASGSTFGATLAWNLKDSTTADMAAATERVVWSNPSHAAPVSNMIWSLVNGTAGTLTDVMTLTPSGLTVTSTANSYVTINAPAASESGILLNKDASLKWELYVPGSSNNLAFYSATLGAIAFQVTGTGELGLGVNSPTAKIHAYKADTSNTIVDLMILSHNLSSGTGTTSLGTAIRMQGNSSNSGARDMGRAYWKWTDAADATRNAEGHLSAFYTTTERDCIAWGANSTDPLLGFYGVTPIARAVLATGAGHTVDDVITALQNLGLVKQS